MEVAAVAIVISFAWLIVLSICRIDNERNIETNKALINYLEEKIKRIKKLEDYLNIEWTPDCPRYQKRRNNG